GLALGCHNSEQRAQSNSRNPDSHLYSPSKRTSIALFRALCAAKLCGMKLRRFGLFLVAAAVPAAADPGGSSGWDKAALDGISKYVQSQKTTGFLIVENRATILEQNWPLPADVGSFKALFTHGTDSRGALQEDVASAQKSFIAILAAIAVDRGLLDVS